MALPWLEAAFGFVAREKVAGPDGQIVHSELVFGDGVIMVGDDDAFAMVKRLAAEEGLLGGSSSGAHVFAALEVARKLGPGKRIATIIPDSAERYLSKNIFDDGK